MKSVNVLKWHSAAAAFLASAAILLGSSVSAEALDAKAVGELVSGHVWQQEAMQGPGFNYWVWNADGSVCLRAEKEGSCIDTGRWRLDGDSLCYEFSWWGKSTGQGTGCLRIASKGNGRYEWVWVDGVSVREFTIVK